MTRAHTKEPAARLEDKLASLRHILERLVERGHPYAKRMAEHGVKPEQIKSARDLSLLPTTTKKDLLDDYPLGWLARDKDEVARFHATSGTTGRPTIVAYTKKDLESWACNMAWCYSLAGVTSSDVVQIAFGYGLFTGGLGYHYGAEKIGAAVVPASTGFSDRQISLMNDLGTTVIAGTPSYAIRLAELMEERGERPRALRLGLFGAEAWTDELRRSLEKKLNFKAYDLYGLSEAYGPCVGMECGEQNGMHICDGFIPQIVDPDTLEELPDGEEGELVLTAWEKEASPCIRYRTRDRARITREPCACGEPTPRVSRISGRTDDMLIMNGVNIFPSQIETSLLTVPGLTANFRIRAWYEDGVQKLSVKCERSPEAVVSDALVHAGARAIKQITGVTIPFEVVEPNALPRFEGKSVKVVRE